MNHKQTRAYHLKLKIKKVKQKNHVSQEKYEISEFCAAGRCYTKHIILMQASQWGRESTDAYQYS